MTRAAPLHPTDRGFGRFAVFALGIVIAIVGLVLTIGGAWLVSLGGSAYYGLAGIGLIAVGVLLMKRRFEAVTLYAAIFVLTMLWALWEAGPDLWALVPRIVGPIVLLVLVFSTVPVLWNRPSQRTLAFATAGLVLLLIVGGAVVLARAEASGIETTRLADTVGADEPVTQTGADWPVYGGTQAAQRYSPLRQINTDNVDQLERAWTYRTGDLPELRWGAETTPLKVGNSVYLCSARNVLIALDASTGRQLWRYDPHVPDENIPYTAACRGVAYFSTQQPPANPADAADAFAPPILGSGACAERIIAGTLDARLIAVDASTGIPCADFGNNGEVDITTGMGEVIPGMVSITSPPTIVRGVIVTGHQVLDGQYRDAPSGVIKGFDAITGELRWAWDLARPDISGLPPQAGRYTRGTPNMWTTASADEQLGYVYLPMGNSAADYWSSSRSPSENAYATSLVALDVSTGRPVWHFQTVHIDVWDYDLGSQATLIDFATPNGLVPALILPSKQGDIYILDRRTGQPLTPVEEREVPQGGAEPYMRSATQPFSGFHTLAREPLTERDMWGMSPVDQMICRIQFRRANYAGMYTPPTTTRRWIQYPGYNGGSDWGGVAVDPHRSVIIANYNDMPNYNRLVPREEANRLGWSARGFQQQGDSRPREGTPEDEGDPQVGTPYAIDVNAGWRLPYTGLLCKRPPYGGIRAIDLRTGKTLWDSPLGTARRNGPFGIPSYLPVTIGTPNNGGAVITAAGLIFIAAATDNLIRAIDIETGETIWQDVLPAGGQATPMVYEADGKQFLVIMAGGHHFMETPVGDYVIAYALSDP